MNKITACKVQIKSISSTGSTGSKYKLNTIIPNCVLTEIMLIISNWKSEWSGTIEELEEYQKEEKKLMNP